MTPTQAPESTSPDDDIDLIVPPLVPAWRRWLLVTAGFWVIAVIAVLPASGLVTPRLAGMQGDVCVPPQPCAGKALGYTFELRNTGWLPAEIESLDAGGPGLGEPSVTLRSVSGPAFQRVLGPHVAFPVRIEPGETVQVTVGWDRLDCPAVARGSSQVMPVSVRGPLGVPVTVPVAPGRFTVPWTGLRVVDEDNDPLAISWSAGITRGVCPGM